MDDDFSNTSDFTPLLHFDEQLLADACAGWESSPHRRTEPPKAIARKDSGQPTEFFTRRGSGKQVKDFTHTGPKFVALDKRFEDPPEGSAKPPDAPQPESIQIQIAGIPSPLDTGKLSVSVSPEVKIEPEPEKLEFHFG